MPTREDILECLEVMRRHDVPAVLTAILYQCDCKVTDEWAADCVAHELGKMVEEGLVQFRLVGADKVYWLVEQEKPKVKPDVGQKSLF